MKILIAGDGAVGDSLTRQLSNEGYDLTLIDSDEKVLEASLDRYDVMAVAGNCAAGDVLKQAGVTDADLLIAATSADEVNLLSCMTSHGLNPKLQTIARIRNPEYTEQIYDMRDLFAISLIVNPERQAASEIEHLLRFPGFLRRESFAKGRVEIVELRVGADSRLNGLSLNDIINNILGFRVLVCIVLRSGTAITPRGDFVLREGDRIFVTAPSENLETMLKKLDIIKRPVNSVMVIGGGAISYYLASRLTDSGMDVTILEKDREKCMEMSSLLPKANIICGDPADRRFLESEGLSHCDALVTLTDSDELNMVIAMLGTGDGVQQVICKVSRMENVSSLAGLPIGSVVSPGELCCNTIAQYVRAMHNQTGAAVAVYSIADGQAEAMEFTVREDDRNCGVPLKNLRMKKGVIMASILHGSSIEISGGNSVFRPGDSVVVVRTGDTVVFQFNDIFE